MASAIDPSVPNGPQAFGADLRANLAAAKAEIEELQVLLDAPAVAATYDFFPFDQDSSLDVSTLPLLNWRTGSNWTASRTITLTGTPRPGAFTIGNNSGHELLLTGSPGDWPPGSDPYPLPHDSWVQLAYYEDTGLLFVAQLGYFGTGGVNSEQIKDDAVTPAKLSDQVWAVPDLEETASFLLGLEHAGQVMVACNHASTEIVATVPLAAPFETLQFDTGTDAFVPGETVTGGTSGASAAVVAVVVESGDWSTNDAAGYLVLGPVSGGPFEAEAITGSSGGAAAALGASVPLATAVNHVGVINLERAGAAAVKIGAQLQFYAGTDAFVSGETVTGGTSGASAEVLDVVVENGDWSTDDATGYLSLGPVSGGPFQAEAIASVSGAAAAAGAEPQIHVESGFERALRGQWSVASIRLKAADEWVLWGGLEASP